MGTKYETDSAVHTIPSASIESRIRLGLNEFRLDLLAYLKVHPNLDLTPFGMSAAVPSSDLVEPGVIYILRNKNNRINIDRSNLLHPFYMVFISRDSEVICDHISPKKLLDKMRYAFTYLVP